MKYYILWLITMCVTPLCYEVAYTVKNDFVKVLFMVIAAVCLAGISCLYWMAHKEKDYEKGYKNGYWDARCKEEIEHEV